MEKEEALCVLPRRYHTINLCDEEQLYNDRHSPIIVETSVTVGGFRVTKPGNPIFALDPRLTERLLSKIMLDTDPESDDSKKARSKVKRPRKLAGRPHLLVKRYVFGKAQDDGGFRSYSHHNLLLSHSANNFECKV